MKKENRFEFEIDNEIDREIRGDFDELPEFDEEETDYLSTDAEDEEYLNEIASFRRKNSGMSLFSKVIISLSGVFLLILFLVLFMNPQIFRGRETPSSDAVSGNVSINSYDRIIAEMEQEHSIQSQIEDSVDELISGSSLTADDLDIWDVSEELEQAHLQDGEETDTEDASEEEVPVSEDGLHTRIVHEDGSEEWVEINPYLGRNTYEYSNFVYQNNLLKYYENNTKVSLVGANISKLQDYVDFQALRHAGVDFVMIRLGQRGFQSGELTLDEYFADNVRRAKDAGLMVGIIFFSEATTEEEAEEEANFVIENLEPFDIDFPVVFQMGSIPHETGRADNLQKMQRTNIALKFMDTVQDAGYLPMLYATKEWLIQKYSLGSMIGYDIWLSQPQDIPDYPYEFSMWQYANAASIEGISGGAQLSISFVDYSLK
ncbi:MAG: GH25 family lysozyme [Lachnospiraceae bacterium]